jgi:hypothetical protein
MAYTVKKKGTKKMKDQEMYLGFSKEEQAKHEKYLIDRYGDEMKEGIAESKRKVKEWKKADWEKSGKEFENICQDLVKLMDDQLETSSPEVQSIIRRHYQWLKKFWTPNKESYAGHALLIVESDLRKAYEAYDPNLAGFLAEGIKVFAEKELS